MLVHDDLMLIWTQWPNGPGPLGPGARPKNAGGRSELICLGSPMSNLYTCVRLCTKIRYFCKILVEMSPEWSYRPENRFVVHRVTRRSRLDPSRTPKPQQNKCKYIQGSRKNNAGHARPKAGNTHACAYISSWRRGQMPIKQIGRCYATRVAKHK